MFSFLSLFAIPLLGAVLFFVIRIEGFRNVAGKVVTVALVAATVLFVLQHREVGLTFFAVPSSYGRLLECGSVGIELVLALIFLFISIRARNWLSTILLLAQTSLTVVNDLLFKTEIDPSRIFMVDRLSVIMVAIVGIVGGLISLYAVGYMKSYHAHHKEIPNRVPFFLFVLFAFLAAMFGIVLSDDLNWIHFFWEITTFCSFLLIGYTQEPQAKKNAFTALILNLIGGIAFTVAIMISEKTLGGSSMSALVAAKSVAGALPFALLCLAGIVKSAQMPFTVWLLGAMVAPTPVSALLHSATMVKAGVYLVLRMSPAIGGTLTGNLVALIGGFTFLAGSLFAVSTSGSKRLLGYSTVANLGLIVACAGIGTYATLWAAVFLMVFHAIAKSLLFLTVGTTGNAIGSIDIEDMDFLIVRMPVTAMLMLVGICGMFIAPFGMLISKWAALEAFINLKSFMAPILICFLAFGSAATMFFWAKWMGKLLMVNKLPSARIIDERKSVSHDEWWSQILLGILSVGVCLLFVPISRIVVEPGLGTLFPASSNIDTGNLAITTIMVGLILVLPALGFFFGKLNPLKHGDRYMGGATTSDDGLTFENSMKEKTEMKLGNYYLGEFFSDRKGFPVATVIAVAFVLALLGGAAL